MMISQLNRFEKTIFVYTLVMIPMLVIAGCWAVVDLAEHTLVPFVVSCSLPVTITLYGILTLWQKRQQEKPAVETTLCKVKKYLLLYSLSIVGLLVLFGSYFQVLRLLELQFGLSRPICLGINTAHLLSLHIFTVSFLSNPMPNSRRELEKKNYTKISIAQVCFRSLICCWLIFHLMLIYFGSHFLLNSIANDHQIEIPDFYMRMVSCLLALISAGLYFHSEFQLELRKIAKGIIVANKSKSRWR